MERDRVKRIPFSTRRTSHARIKCQERVDLDMSGQGDPRVHFAMNLVLSAVFAAVILWGSEFVGVTTFTLGRFAVFTLLLMLITHLATR